MRPYKHQLKDENDNDAVIVSRGKLPSFYIDLRAGNAIHSVHDHFVSRHITLGE
jgi:hypothetical protein